MNWDEYAAGWDDDEGARAYASAAFESLVETCARWDFSLRGIRVCDFGCGTGLLTEKLAPASGEIVAIDSSAAMLDVLRGKVARLGFDHVHCASALEEHLDQSSSDALEGPFDLVVCSSVCAFLDDYPATVERLAGYLRRGGLFVQWDWERNPADEEPFGLTRDEIRRALVQAGLEVLTVATGFTITSGDMEMAPLMGIGRRR